MVLPFATRFEIDPLSELHRLQRDFNRLFRGFFEETETYPAFNIWATNDESIVHAELPGVDPNDLNIEISGSQLTLEGERKQDFSVKEANFHRKERGFGTFIRSIRLPFEIDTEKIQAKYINGVLEINLPRAETSKPKKISIHKE